MARRNLLRLSARILLAWALLSAAGAMWGRYAAEALIPILTLVTDAATTSFIPVLEYRSLPDGDQLVMTAYVMQPMYVHSALTVNPGAIMTVGIDALHVLVPLVILFIALLAWPVGSRRERWLLMALGLPAAFIVSALTVPFLLTGKLQIMLMDYASRAGQYRSPGLTVYWMIFCESGGRWLLPLVAAAVCILTVRPRAESIKAAPQRSQNIAGIKAKPPMGHWIANNNG